MHRRAVWWLVLAIVAGAEVFAQIPAGGVVTTGEAPSRPCGVTRACTSGLAVNSFMQLCGTITAPDGSTWELPSPITDGPAAVDIYNDCTGQGDNPDYLEQVENVVVDADGVEITGYVFADNYYELWVNGTFIARDSLGMTPFNSTIVRFKAKYPVTYAFKAVDWDTHPGLGMEYDSYRFLFEIPPGWTAPAFDDSSWPHATLYPADQVTGTPGYVRYAESFEPAQFIWTRNLVLDNLVLARHTVEAPPE